MEWTVNYNSKQINKWKQKTFIQHVVGGSLQLYCRPDSTLLLGVNVWVSMVVLMPSPWYGVSSDERMPPCGVYKEVWTASCESFARGLEATWLDGISDNSALVDND